MQHKKHHNRAIKDANTRACVVIVKDETTRVIAIDKKISYSTLSQWRNKRLKRLSYAGQPTFYST